MNIGAVLLWHSEQSHHLWSQYQLWTPAQVPAPLPIHVPADMSGKEAENGPSVWASVTHVGDPEETPRSFLYSEPVLAVAAGGESMDERSAFPALCSSFKYTNLF